MRRAFLLLVIIIAGYYGNEAWQVYNRLAPLKYVEKGSLTEFAERVIPVVLDTAGGPVITAPCKIRREAGSLYLVSENTLYRFSDKGEYLSQITSPDDIQVADYLVDTHNGQLIVMGNTDDIYYYTLEGDFKNKIKFPADERYSCLRSVAYYRNRVWIVKDVAGEDNNVHRVVAEYDTTFIPLNTYPLSMADITDKPELFTCLKPQFSIAPDTGEIYVYDPIGKPGFLLRDTLVIRQKRRLFAGLNQTNHVLSYPFRMGSRFYLSSHDADINGENGYIYCHDEKTNTGWYLAEGIRDNIYRTGQIEQLYPMDLTGDCYYYVKSGNDLAVRFPDAARRDIPVVFIVEMKS